MGGLFTQEDPIGLAGGMNLYGFANGDPINFSDPFGLKAGPCDGLRGTAECRLMGQLRGAVDAAIGLVKNTVGRLRAGAEANIGNNSFGADCSGLRGCALPMGINLNPDVSAELSLALELEAPADGSVVMTGSISLPRGALGVPGLSPGIFLEMACTVEECRTTGVGLSGSLGLPVPGSAADLNVEVADLSRRGGR
jgi:hypothetical protein